MVVLYLFSDDATYFNHFKERMNERSGGVLAAVLFGGTTDFPIQQCVLFNAVSRCTQCLWPF